LHIRIELRGNLEFGAYGQFHPGCVVIGRPASEDIIDALVSEGAMARYSSTGR
jgi:hypothetical protein